MVKIKCCNCNREFEDNFKGVTEMNRRIWCNSCVINLYNEFNKNNNVSREQSLKEICEELGVKWTNNPKDIAQMIDEGIEKALLKEQREKDL